MFQEPEFILQKYWGYSAFRPLQKDIVSAVLAKKDVLALMPTGGGKSICFQVPAIMMDGICIVVSPLIALIKDQVYQLKKREIAAEALYSGMDHETSTKILDHAVNGTIKFLYVSPERLQVSSFLDRAQYMRISLLAIDEAHCISQWGYDFRPQYAKISDFKRLAPKANVIALTATATPIVKKDIIDKLDLSKPSIFQKSFTRENLAYRVVKTENKFGETLKLLQKHSGTAIIYVNTRKKTIEIAKLLNTYGIHSTAYNAGLDSDIRDQRQDEWIKGTTRVIVATNAFGMGIDKPDVRLVIHLDFPQSLEAYYQEAGRAGRDENESVAFLLYEDCDELELLEDIERVSIRPDLVRTVYENICNNYSIAMDAVSPTKMDFNIESFSKKYQVKQHEVYKAISILEQNNLLNLSENFKEKSKINIKVSISELHQFFAQSPKAAPLLKNILRVYGGEIFHNYSKISETLLANNTNMPIEDVKKMLVYLSKCEIISYIPTASVPQMSLLQPRVHKNRLQIDDRGIEKLNDTYLEKAKQMIQYAKQKLVCRVQFILDYFGEKTFDRCKKCDLCIVKKLTHIDNDFYNYHLEKLVQFLQKPKSLNEIITFLNFENENDCMNLLSEMIKFGDIEQVELDSIVISKKYILSSDKKY